MQSHIGWIRWLPGLAILRDYRAAWLAHDVVAGIVLAAILVPVGIAYAIASGVPGIYGLYATIIPLRPTHCSGQVGSSYLAPTPLLQP
jgi:MFS superfamily sulfate permease-like transporter